MIYKKGDMMEDKIITAKMEELAKRIDYEFHNISFLKEAMHCQKIQNIGDGKNRKNYTNDPYATLGDAILKFVLTEDLFDKGFDKAKITQIKEIFESNSILSCLRDQSGILKYAYNNSYFFYDAPEENKLHSSEHDVYIEAIIAAIYKDRGMDYCKKWIRSFFLRYNANALFN